VSYDPGGFIASVDVDRELIDRAIESGTPFMTDGCPDRTGVMACNRPFGSYRPGEEFRDYPFVPGESDLEVIRVQLNLGEICPAYA
jgi:biotin synthase